MGTLCASLSRRELFAPFRIGNRTSRVHEMTRFPFEDWAAGWVTLPNRSLVPEGTAPHGRYAPHNSVGNRPPFPLGLVENVLEDGVLDR